MELDPLDRAILAVLLADGRASFREIARRLDSTTPTVSARVKRLQALGVIKQFTAVIDETLLPGRTMVARYVPADGRMDDVLVSVHAHPATRHVDELADGSILARLRMGDASGPPAFDGASVAETHRVIAEGAHDEHAPSDFAIACHACRGPVHGEGVRVTIEGHAHVFCCRLCETDYRAKYARLRSGA